MTRLLRHTRHTLIAIHFRLRPTRVFFRAAHCEIVRLNDNEKTDYERETKY